MSGNSVNRKTQSMRLGRRKSGGKHEKHSIDVTEAEGRTR